MDTIELKDQRGEPVGLGDFVIVLIRNVNRCRMQEGTVTDINGEYLTVTYDLAPNWYRKAVLKQSVVHRADWTVKVAK